MVKIATVLNYGNPGEQISVRFANGETATVIAGNVINSNKVLVAGGYCWSSTSPRIQIENKSAFKSGQTPKIENPIACQLVGATLIEGIREVIEIAPYVTRVFETGNQSWNYNQTLHRCEAVDDGSGEYSNEQSCLTANVRPKSDYFMVNWEWFINETITNGTQNQANLLIQGETVAKFSQILPYYGFAGNGDHAVPRSKRDRVINSTIRGFLDYNTYSRQVIISTTNPSGNWLELTIGDGTNITASIANDVVQNLQGQQTTIGLLPFQCALDANNKYVCTYDDPNIYSYQDILALPDLSYFSVIPEYFNTVFSTADPRRDIVSMDANLTVEIRLNRNIYGEYLNHTFTQGWFVKFHDPDLPLIPITEIESSRTYTPYFLFFGDRAYFVLKIGKIRNLNVSESERLWYKIRVVEIKEDSTVNTNEYLYPETVSVDKDNVLSFLTDAYLDTESDNPCLNLSNHKIDGFNNFNELNYQQSLNRFGTIEYKVPGFLFPID